MPASRADMVSGKAQSDSPLTGLRTQADIEERLVAIREDAKQEAIPIVELDALEALLAVRETLPYALQHLRDIAVDMPWVRVAVDRFEARSAVKLSAPMPDRSPVIMAAAKAPASPSMRDWTASLITDRIL